MSRISHEQLAAAVSELFPDAKILDADSDLSLYIKDSIDLGELIALLRERHGVVPQDMQAFKSRTRLGDVLAIFNHELG